MSQCSHEYGFFFFSSRRRHTRLQGDWSSDVCSSDLPDDPTGFVPSRLWKLPSITTWDDSRNQNHPTDSAEEAYFLTRIVSWPPVRCKATIYLSFVETVMRLDSSGDHLVGRPCNHTFGLCRWQDAAPGVMPNDVSFRH